MVSQTAAHSISARSTAPSQPVLSLPSSRPGDGGGLRSGVVSLLFRFVTHSSHSYSAQITAHCHFYPAQVAARWLEKHSSVKVDFVVIAQVGSTHRFSTAPESRRTVISIPPRWRQHYGTPMSRRTVISIPPRWWHGGLRSTAPSRSILLSSPRWGRLIAFLQRPNHGALSFLSRPGGGNTLAMRFLHMARLCHGTLSFLSRPGGGNTLATAYCCIWRSSRSARKRPFP